MNPINGVPHPKGSAWGKKLPGGGGRKGGCLGVLIALFTGSWLLDLALAASRAAA